jgi:hypothetical protein
MVDVQTLRTQYRVSDFVAWQRDGALELNPNFQRRPVWKKGAKSYLIDTILRGLPVPIIFLRDLPSDLKTLRGKRDVVDGQQRIRTLLSFIDPKLLRDFDSTRDEFRIDPVHNSEQGGKSFTELDEVSRQRILDYQFSVHSFAADTDDRQILQIFARMNSTGYKLNPQELRNAEFFGRFKTLAYEVATEQLNRWRDWKIFNPDQIARMHEVELTSEFMLLILDGILERHQTTIDGYYRKYDQNFPDGPEVQARFRTTFDAIESLLPRQDIVALFSNKTIFYALFAGTYSLQFSLRTPPTAKGPPRTHQKLTKERARAIKNRMADQMRGAATSIANDGAPPQVLKSTRGSSAHAGARREVIRYLLGEDNDPWPRLL